MCVPGHPALRRADARGHLGRHGAGFRGVGVPDHPVSVLPVPAADQLARVHLHRSGQEELTEEGKRFATRRELVQKTRIVAAQRSFGPAVAVY